MSLLNKEQKYGLTWTQFYYFPLKVIYMFVLRKKGVVGEGEAIVSLICERVKYGKVPRVLVFFSNCWRQ